MNKKLFTWIGFGCAVFGCLLTFIFAIVTCANPKIKYDKLKIYGYSTKYPAGFKMSLLFIGTIIGLMITIAGIVLAILGMEKETSLFKVTIITLAVGAFAVFYGLISTMTVCSYNCSLNKGFKSKLNSEVSKKVSGFDIDDWD